VVVKVIGRIDSKGRLYIPKKIREKLSGDEVYLVEIGGRVVIVPKPRDPVKDLEEVGKDLPDKPIGVLREEILRQAMEEIE